MNEMVQMWTLREDRVAAVFQNGRDEVSRLKGEVLGLRNEADAVEVELALAEREARGLEESLERNTISMKNQIVGVVHLMYVLLNIGSTAPSSWRDSNKTFTAGLAKMMQLFYREVRATCWRSLGIPPGIQVFPRSATAPFSRAAMTTLNGLIDFGHYRLGINSSFTSFPVVFVGDASLSRAHFLVEPHLYDWVRGIVHPSSGPLTHASAMDVGSGSTCVSVVVVGPSTSWRPTHAVASMPASPMDWSPARSPEQAIVPFALTYDVIEDATECDEQPRLVSEDLTLGEVLRDVLSVWARNVRVAKENRTVLDAAILSNQVDFEQSCVAATTLRVLLSVWAHNVRVAKQNRTVLDAAILSNQADFEQSCHLNALRIRQEEGRLLMTAQCFADVHRLKRSLAAWRFSLFSSAMSDSSDGMSCASGISSNVSTPPPRTESVEAFASTSTSPPSTSSSSSSSRPSSSPPNSRIENAVASKKKNRRGSIFIKGKKRITSPKFGRYALRSLDINVG